MTTCRRQAMASDDPRLLLVEGVSWLFVLVWAGAAFVCLLDGLRAEGWMQPVAVNPSFGIHCHCGLAILFRT